MVGRRSHSTATIESRRKTFTNRSLKVTLAISIIVDTLEELEDLRIRGLVGSEASTEVLTGDVGVTNDTTVTVEILGGGVVGLVGVGEGAGDEVVDANGNVEGSVGGDVFAGLGGEDDGGDHVGLGGDLTHDNAVT